MHMKIKLQEIHTQIAATILPKDFATLVLLELLPLLQEPGPLKTAYNARVHYYERLAKDKQYLVLIQTIHAAMKDVHRLIDPTKFAQNSKHKFFHPSRFGLVSAKEMYALLVQKDQWSYLGHKTIKGFKDSILCPWRTILSQYWKVITWMRYSVHVGAVGEQAVQPSLKHLRSSYGKLEQMLMDPFERLHIKEFEHFHIRTSDPEQLLADESPKGFFELRHAANCVCRDLLAALDLSEAEERSSTDPKPHSAEEKPAVLTEWTGDQSVSFDGENLKVGTLSDKIPTEDDAENRRVLLTMLVKHYQECKKKDEMGISEAFFKRKLNEIGLSSGVRCLETAARGINKEIEGKLSLRRFIRMRGTTARIFKVVRKS